MVRYSSQDSMDCRAGIMMPDDNKYNTLALPFFASIDAFSMPVRRRPHRRRNPGIGRETARQSAISSQGRAFSGLECGKSFEDHRLGSYN
jgi:hypothetical protein